MCITFLRSWICTCFHRSNHLSDLFCSTLDALSNDMIKTEIDELVSEKNGEFGHMAIFLMVDVSKYSELFANGPTLFDATITAFEVIKKMNLMGYLVKIIAYIEYIMIKLFFMEYLLHIYALLIHLFVVLLTGLFTAPLVELCTELLHIFQVFLMENIPNIFELLIQLFTALVLELLAQLLHIFKVFLIDNFLHILELLIQLLQALLIQLFTVRLVELFVQLLDIFQVFWMEHFLNIFVLLIQLSRTLLLAGIIFSATVRIISGVRSSTRVKYEFYLVIFDDGIVGNNNS
eukprot:308509_1